MNPQIEKIADSFFGAGTADNPLLGQPPQDLRDFKVEQVRGMQTFLTRIEPLLNALPRRRLKNPVYDGRGIQDDHRASRSSRTRRALSIPDKSGLRSRKRSRRSASVGFSAISLISARR